MKNHIIIFVPHFYPHEYNIGEMLKHTGLWVNVEINPETWEKVVAWKTGIDLEKDQELLESEWKAFIERYYPQIIPLLGEWDPVTILGVNINLDKVSARTVSNRCLFQAMGIFWEVSFVTEKRQVARATLQMLRTICHELGQVKAGDSISELLMQLPTVPEEEEVLRKIAKGIVKDYPEILNQNQNQNGDQSGAN